MTVSSEPPVPPVPPQVAPVTETTFIATAAGNDDPPAPVKGLRRLMVWIIPANLGVFLVWGAVPGILLPQQVTEIFGEQQKVASLAIIMTIGAFAAMIAQPIAGQISDRTRSRFGRRAPWIVIGSLAGALSLVGLAFASSFETVIPLLGALGLVGILVSTKSFAKDLGVVNIAATLPQTLAPGVAGVIVLLFGFAGLFPVAIVLGILGACAVWPIKATK